MQDILDLERYPLDRPDTAGWQALVLRCRRDLADDGLFNLPGFLRADAVAKALEQLRPVLAGSAFTHERSHNIYFRDRVEGLPDDHPALAHRQTINHTICADQIAGSVVLQLYDWPPFARFLAAVMDKPRLFAMADPLARVNVMEYRAGEALNWHFDRSEFTTTLLLQAPMAGGDFEYARDLRSGTDPNYAGVARLLQGQEPTVVMPLNAGTLNVFAGKNTAHRVTPVMGETPRIIAVFSYFEIEGVMFTEAERLGFYGRSGTTD